MKILIRASGERTTQKCIKLASQHGDVEVIEEYPFGESIRKTYIRAMEIDQEWTPVIDADVLLYPGVIEKSIRELNQKKDKRKIICLDGKTKDKIFLMDRRAGIHIYRTENLSKAIKYVENNKTKPETNVRKKMGRIGYRTHVGKIVFGLHDHEQYYKDLWRKSVCQVYKLGKMIDQYNMVQRWKELSEKDYDYFVISQANKYGKSVGKVTIDARKDYGARENLEKLGIEEKEELKT